MSEGVKVHTHYDNLKVARGAPEEVIKAAYRALAQKYHPDKWGDNGDATRVMTIINNSYSILIDPKTRAEHDAWIKKKEEAMQKGQSHPKPTEDRKTAPTPSPRPQQAPPPVPPSKKQRGSGDKLFKMDSIVIGLIGLVIVWVIYGASSAKRTEEQPAYSSPSSDYSSTPPTLGQSGRQAQAPVSEAIYNTAPTAQVQRSIPGIDVDPLGRPWQSNTGPIKGMPIQRAGGLSIIHIDNSQNASAIYAKVMAADVTPNRAVRHIYIAPWQKATISAIQAGLYKVKYIDLLSRQSTETSSLVELVERPIPGGTEYSETTITLHKVKNGNLRTTGISTADFLSN